MSDRSSSILLSAQETDVRWRRLSAVVIDALFILMFLPPGIYIYHVINLQNRIIFFPWGASIPVGYIGAIVYFTACEWLFGSTLGKDYHNLRVVCYDGRRISILQAFTRNVLKIAEIYILLLSIILADFEKYHRRIGDFAARTVVVDATTTANPYAPKPYYKLLILAILLLFDIAIVIWAMR